VALLALLSCARVFARDADVVYHEPHLSLQYANDIHPYAWSAMRPDPYYTDQINAYSVGDRKVLDSFLDTQTHIGSKSPQASTLLEVTEDLSVTSSRRGIFGKIAKVGLGFATGGLAGAAVGALAGGAKRLMEPNVDPKGWSTVMDHKDVRNPASSKTPDFHPIDSDFLKIPNAGHTTGSFPGSQHYRRAQWGFRRRRLPYFSKSEGFGSANPFRSPNSFFGTPNDLLSPNAKWSPIRNPGAFDVAAATAAVPHLPYGGYSSFHARRLRAAKDAGAASFPPVPDVRFADADSRLGDNTPLLSDGSPAHFRHSGKNMRWDGDKFAPTASPFGAVSPYVHGLDGQFFDFYGGGGGGGGGSDGGEGSSAL